jgi:hypothetical protein
MRFPKTVDEYWKLSREEREELFQKHGFGWRTITEGVWHNKKDDQQKEDKGEQTKLDLFGDSR